ncbi:MAG: GNAT family N-acetyltransferase [Actinobacteria bacterium]|nr:GNAT family N-acetyltransferase [Actinomycetota bacterium]
MNLPPPRRLQRSDDRTGFHSGVTELDEWLVTYAWQNQQAGNAVTYVVSDRDRVAGYYAIAMAAVARSAAPEPLQKGRPSQIPCILLARLAVDVTYTRRGFGWGLLRDALARSVQLSGSIGAAAVLVHCQDDEARRFYLHHGDFLPSPANDLHLMIPIRALDRYLG